MHSTVVSKYAGIIRLPESEIPWRQWTLLALVAVVGSCLYGASLSLVFSDWGVMAAALWLALSAGLAWCVFIPALCWIAKASLTVCLDDCLATMAFGEVVLASGALVNVLLWSRGLLVNAAPINAIIVAISNVVMVIALASQMSARGVPVPRVLALWMLVLNGSGALFFFLLYQRLHTP